MKKKILIFIITYKASFRLKNVYNEIPFKKLKNHKVDILICDDASKDDTITYAVKIKNKNKDKKIFIIENKKNLGYGGNIKKCLKYSINKNYNYAVMIHGDGQYSPGYIPYLINYLIKMPEICASTGSRVLGGVKSALKGGMPFYKLIGNIVLTKIFKLLFNKKFTDAHTGLWAYNLVHLKNKKFNSLTDGYNFDQEFRFKTIMLKKEIKEIPIKTKYGDERSQIHLKYAINFFFKTISFFLIKSRIISSKKFR